MRSVVIGALLSMTLLSCSDDDIITNPDDIMNGIDYRPYIGKYEGQWIVNRQSADKAIVALDSLLTISRLPQREILQAVLGDERQTEAIDNKVYKSCQLKPEFIGFSESSAYFSFQPQTLSFNTTYKGKAYSVVLHLDVDINASIKIVEEELMEIVENSAVNPQTFKKEVVITYSGNKQ